VLCDTAAALSPVRSVTEAVAGSRPQLGTLLARAFSVLALWHWLSGIGTWKRKLVVSEGLDQDSEEWMRLPR
jgi:predicted outer membrane lipoprotein